MKKKYILVTLVSLIVVLSIGLTYALFYSSISQSDLNALNTSCFDVTYTENSNSINLVNSYPMKDSKGLKLTPYTFTITNTCNVTSEYVVTLNTINSSSTILLPYINMSLDGSTIKKLNSYDKTNQTNNLKTLYNIKDSYQVLKSTLEANESRTYNIRLWIDESAGNNIMGEGFEARVIVINTGITLSPADVTLAVKLQDKENNGWLGTYTNGSSFPDSSSGYLYQGIECDDPNVKVNAVWDSTNYEFTTFSYNKISGPVKCYIKFGDKVGGDYILSTWTNNNIPINTTDTPDFSQVVTTEVGVFTANDDYTAETGKKSYYVRGSSSYNYVKFGKDINNNDIWWRIIRINGDGTIRMIYQGTSYDASGIYSVLWRGHYPFNNLGNDNAYFGYKYTIGERQGLSTASRAMQEIDWWFLNGTNLQTLKSKLADSIFCGDRSSYIGTGIGTETTGFGSLHRLYENDEPSLICPEELDKYTTINSSDGNKSLTLPIALITADEVVFAGGSFGIANTSYYLYSSGNFWTMTPPNSWWDGDNYIMTEYLVINNGELLSAIVQDSTEIGLRPVINLQDNVTITGNGTSTSPFQIS